jgi:hypothetical protein
MNDERHDPDEAMERFEDLGRRLFQMLVIGVRGRNIRARESLNRGLGASLEPWH